MINDGPVCPLCGMLTERWLIGSYMACNPPKYETMWLCVCGWHSNAPWIRMMGKDERKMIGLELPERTKKPDAP